MAVILNIEEDHLDFFKDIDDIRRSFRQFIEKVPENGTIIMNGTIENWRGADGRCGRKGCYIRKFEGK